MIYQFEACDKKNKKPKVSQAKETKKKHTHSWITDSDPKIK